MEIITHNPFRLLGIYGNLPIRDIISQASKIKAYVKVGQPMDTPIQINQWLPAVSLTEQEVKRAEDLLHNPSEKARYAMFWFERHCQKDEQFVTLFSEKKVEEAMACLAGRDDHAALQNMLTAGLILNNWQDVLFLAMRLHKEKADIALFLETLSQEVDISVFRTSFKSLSQSIKDDATTLTWRQQLDEKVCHHHNQCLDEFYRKVCNVNPRDEEALKEMLNQFLLQSEHIVALKDILGANDASYQASAERYVEKLWGFTELCRANNAGNVNTLPKIARKCRELAVTEYSKNKFDKLTERWENVYNAYIKELKRRGLETPEGTSEESTDDTNDEKESQIKKWTAILKEMGGVYLIIFWILIFIVWLIFK